MCQRLLLKRDSKKGGQSTVNRVTKVLRKIEIKNQLMILKPHRKKPKQDKPQVSGRI